MKVSWKKKPGSETVLKKKKETRTYIVLQPYVITASLNPKEQHRHSSYVSADKTIAGKHPGAVGNLPQSGYGQLELTTYGASEN